MRILDQLRLVVANQKAVVWISASMPIIFTPKQTGLLVNQSRIIVKVDAFNSYHGLQPPTTPVTKENKTKFNNIGMINAGMLHPYLNVSKRLVLRAIHIDTDGKKNLIHPYTVFVHEDLVGKRYKDLIVILATMQTIPSILAENAEDENESNNKVNDLCVEIVPIDSVIFRSLCREVYNRDIPTVLLPRSLNTIVNIENGMKIMLTIIGDSVEQPEHIDVLTYSEQIQSEIDVIERFKSCVIESTHSGKKFLINDGMVKQNLEISSGFLQFKLKPEKVRYTMLNSESFRHCTIAAKCLSETDLVLPKLATSTLEYDYRNYCRSMKSIEDLIERVISHLYFEIHRDASFKGASEIKSNVLITGKIIFLYIINIIKRKSFLFVCL